MAEQLAPRVVEDNALEDNAWKITQEIDGVSFKISFLSVREDR